jgi:hypothetical protein
MLTVLASTVSTLFVIARRGEQHVMKLGCTLRLTTDEAISLRLSSQYRDFPNASENLSSVSVVKGDCFGDAATQTEFIVMMP